MTSSTTFGALQQDIDSFQDYLSQSVRVLALLGAGLSASSGLPTFRGAGGLWRTHDSVSLATPEAFADNPGLVWQFYSYRRHMALQAKPNPAHYALAELARRKPGFMALSQNVDGLSQRANHAPLQLQLLHGNLFEVKCSNVRCDYCETNITDPIVPALAIPTDGSDPTANAARAALDDQLPARTAGKALDISDVKVPIPELTRDQLPQCPECTKLLRPAVVWFGESLPSAVLETIDHYIRQAKKIDLIMVIGTSAQVYPAAGYIGRARRKGARVCVVNMDPTDVPADGWNDGDWFFQGDAAEIIPLLFKPVIGDIGSYDDAEI